MKLFKDVKTGDITTDYNGETGIVTRKAKRGEPLFDELTKDWKEDECLNEDEDFSQWDGVIEVEGDKYGPFGEFGKVVFVYGHDGAWVDIFS